MDSITGYRLDHAFVPELARERILQKILNHIDNADHLKNNRIYKLIETVMTTDTLENMKTAISKHHSSYFWSEAEIESLAQRLGRHSIFDDKVPNPTNHSYLIVKV